MPRINSGGVLPSSPSIRFSPPPTSTTPLLLSTMSSTQATGVPSSPSHSPLMNVNWGVRQSGPESLPPCLGVDEFAVVNPDFWSGTPEEQRAMNGWYWFSDVSIFSFNV